MARLPPKAAAGERNGTMKTKFSKHLCRLFVFLLLSVMLATTAFADMGPKPSLEVRVEIEGEKRAFYAAILVNTKQFGPHGVMEPNPNADSGSEPETEAERAEYAFLNFRDPDGYNYVCRIFTSETGGFKWNYYPPETFKVLLWFPDTGELVCSESLDCYAFESAFEVSFADGRLSAKKQLDIPGKALGFLARVAVTLLLECWLAITFGYRKGLRYVVAANVVTQLALNAGLAVCIHFIGGNWFFFYLAYLFLELLVFLAEWCYYSYKLPQTNPEHPHKRRVFAYALLANLLSFIGGVGLNLLWPMVF
jgi:hypothetical protein